MERLALNYTPVAREMTRRGLFVSIHGTRDRVIPWSEALVLTGAATPDLAVIDFSDGGERSSSLSPESGIWSECETLRSSVERAALGTESFINIENKTYIIPGATHNFTRHLPVLVSAVSAALDRIARFDRGGESSG